MDQPAHTLEEVTDEQGGRLNVGGFTDKHAFSYEELLECARGEMFGPGNAQLPAPPMLMFNRITHVSEEGGKYGKGEIVAELDIRPDLWFFEGHFLGDPVMPGCLGVDALWQLVGFYLGWLGEPGRGRALGAGEIKFSSMVLPSAKLLSFHIDFKRVIRRKLILAIAEGVVKIDGEIACEADGLRVGLFSDAAQS